VSAQIDQEIKALDVLIEDRLPEINLMLRMQEIQMMGAP
jgi:hypothetical protein